MWKPKILIVGCGAVGLTQGYILSAGAEITYLENVLRTFDNYRVIESPSDVANEEFYCVFDSLDGHTARSEGGRATLKAVGDLIRDHPTTFVLYDAIGIDIVDHYASTMDISKERLIFCASILAHQPTKSISIPATANASLIAQADMLYSYNTGDRSLIMFNTDAKLIKAFSDVYNKHPKLRIMVMPGFLASSGLMMISMLQLMAWSIDGWHPLPEFRNNTEVWNLMLRAQNEILALPRYGWTGKLMAILFGSWVSMKAMATPVEAALPLQVHEFNAFHHGSKVIKQDLMLLEELVAEGEKEKHKMIALREVVRRAEEQARAV